MATTLPTRGSEQESNSQAGCAISSRRSIHLVPRPKTFGEQVASHANTRIVCGGFLADVVVDTHSQPPIYHWIVQRAGSAEVLHWAQETSFEEAERAAEAFLKQLARKERRRA
jgi:hypothetical protein